MVLGTTKSLCPICLSISEAEIVSDGEGVRLKKTCARHGEFDTLIWRGSAESYSSWGKHSQSGGGPEKILSKVTKGCPYDCGPCMAHTEGVCLALIEVTARCNLACPICFARSNESRGEEPDMKTIRRRYETILQVSGPAPVQLSGGEPTMRDDLPQIVAMGKDLGFDMIQINTNGVRLATDVEYLEMLRKNGAKVLYLQFDGVTDDVYEATRGAHLMDTKIKVLENCSRTGMAVVLVPTVVPGVNDSQVGSIVRFAKKWMPVVRGVHFQPISYFGRYPKSPDDKNRITIPEIMAAMEAQTDGEIRQADFEPRISKDGHCAFSGFFILNDDGSLKSGFRTASKINPLKPAPSVRGFLSKHWSPAAESSSCQACSCTGAPEVLPDDILDWVNTRTLTISGMPFQDAWNIDLQRLSGCCIYVATEERLVPFCAYYLTSASGRRLYGP
jgi:7,8-dihydro-6-hydroxymethylpterin dimethyltransferase